MYAVLGSVSGVLALIVIAAGAPYSAKLERAKPPASLSTAHRQLLAPEALLVRVGEAPVMRIWFRAAIPVQATEEQFRSGLTYRQIPEGTLIGAIELPKVFIDYRKQRIPAGTYTLRFAIQPDTGDHTGTSPHPEFCLLSPAAEDTSTRAMAPKQLIELSSRVNGGRHPAVLLLWPHNSPNGDAKVIDQGNGVVAATVQRPVAAGTRRAQLGFAITVAGWRKP